MKIGVIGAGTMGSGIAQAFAAYPAYEVLLTDVNIDLAKKGASKIASKLAKRVEKGKMNQADADALTARIKPALVDDLKPADLIIEAALEKMDVKKELFKKLQTICSKDAIFASNTSSLSLTELAAGLDRNVVGMHFFNPAEVMKLVEVIAGADTPPELVEKISSIARDIGKTPVVVKDSPGFVVNRVLIPMINEAIGILAEGVADAKGIDSAMTLGANMPMGPLALCDLIGLDITLAIMEILYTEMGDPKYRPHPLLRKMVRAGHLGQKTGKGFYTY
jgi:3-hydroxybutyryl-CoA dehydrogenase